MDYWVYCRIVFLSNLRERKREREILESHPMIEKNPLNIKYHTFSNYTALLNVGFGNLFAEKKRKSTLQLQINKKYTREKDDKQNWLHFLFRVTSMLWADTVTAKLQTCATSDKSPLKLSVLEGWLTCLLQIMFIYELHERVPSWMDSPTKRELSPQGPWTGSWNVLNPNHWNPEQHFDMMSLAWNNRFLSSPSVSVRAWMFSHKFACDMKESLLRKTHIVTALTLFFINSAISICFCNNYHPANTYCINKI